MRIDFRGKDAIYNYHLTVPLSPLVADESLSVGEADLGGNLIVHGDNLRALKALMPHYGGKVDCVFIDPPYNTGNEHWVYNDAVNSPPIKEWLGHEVGSEDLLRHEKWCCMMWPRLKLLHELLSEEGSFWMTLDDNEVSHATMMLDEIFGEDSRLTTICWQKRTSRENRAAFSSSHDYLLAYTKGSPDDWKVRRNLLPAGEGGYGNPDDDPRGPWRSIPFSAQGYRKAQVYDIETPTGQFLAPPRGRCWGATEPEYFRLKGENRVYFPDGGNGRPRLKRFPWEDKGLVPLTLWFGAEVGTTEEAKKEVLAIIPAKEGELPFDTPKPTRLAERILQIATREDSLVLDSFAGSGTTGHAVLRQNAADDKKRRFILIEAEDYADTLTAERIRRVILGYPFKGKIKSELYRNKLSWTKLERIKEEATTIKAEADTNYDKVKVEVQGGDLVVTGITDATENAPGLGGNFTFCTLGEPLDLDRMLSGDTLPAWQEVGTWLFHTAMGATLPPEQLRQGEGVDEWYVAESETHHVWVLYRPEAEFLRRGDAALTLNLAKSIAERRNGKPHLVFAPYRLASNDQLRPLHVEYAPLPFSLHRLETA